MQPAEQFEVLEPTQEIQEGPSGEWIPLTQPDRVARYLETALWERTESPTSWEVARSSRSVYFYRETGTQQTVVAKYYSIKTGPTAEKYAQRELEGIQLAQEAGLGGDGARAVQCFGTWQGVLFLEYIDGLTLEDLIAIHRSRPGTLKPGLAGIARLLARLHAESARPELAPDITPALHSAHKIIDNLSRHGVLQRNPIIQTGLLRLVDRWAADPKMSTYTPTFSHGDATTTNFVFPQGESGVVALDWERHGYADPAADLGRIQAEITHSLTHHGGSVEEALPLAEHLSQAYCQALTPILEPEAILERARFFRAITSMRIARNGWLPRLDRTDLVAQSLALLS